MPKGMSAPAATAAAATTAGLLPELSPPAAVVMPAYRGHPRATYASTATARGHLARAPAPELAVGQQAARIVQRVLGERRRVGRGAQNIFEPRRGIADGALARPKDHPSGAHRRRLRFVPPCVPYPAQECAAGVGPCLVPLYPRGTMEEPTELEGYEGERTEPTAALRHPISFLRTPRGAACVSFLRTPRSAARISFLRTPGGAMEEPTELEGYEGKRTEPTAALRHPYPPRPSRSRGASV
eukprot:tig00000411_g508.t1